MLEKISRGTESIRSTGSSMYELVKEVDTRLTGVYKMVRNAERQRGKE